MMVIVKCGTPQESTQSKPGNRGKRDSQIDLGHVVSLGASSHSYVGVWLDLFLGNNGVLEHTLDSIAMTDYPNSHKTILVICDGIIKGKGEEFSTSVDLGHVVSLGASSHSYVGVWLDLFLGNNGVLEHVKRVLGRLWILSP
jgi:hypothetical protein